MMEKEVISGGDGEGKMAMGRELDVKRERKVY